MSSFPSRMGKSKGDYGLGVPAHKGKEDIGNRISPEFSLPFQEARRAIGWCLTLLTLGLTLSQGHQGQKERTGNVGMGS
jgi:hypothetical protein